MNCETNTLTHSPNDVDGVEKLGVVAYNTSKLTTDQGLVYVSKKTLETLRCNSRFPKHGLKHLTNLTELNCIENDKITDIRHTASSSLQFFVFFFFSPCSPFSVFVQLLAKKLVL